MALCFFDFINSRAPGAAPDTLGTEFADRDLIPAEAVAVLVSNARDRLPDGEHRIFSASVRDYKGRVIYAATLTLDAGWVT
jgi:hypothetical protein